ncbi:PGPGW domain-containing protein [Nocardioides sp. SYSU DS0663]|uniref:PGPGW domain-containing protein n=1 Tax=Nocardioides sp. SYSU DS0663 TaxID=3416445 RepID=UPI003F4B2207
MRLLTEPLGWLLVGVGVVLFPLPGPGLLLLAAGLVLLAEQYEWAARHLRAARAAARDGALGSPVRTVLSFATTIVLALGGLLWLWPGWSWLPGGVWTGVGQLVSGLAGLVVLLRERRRRDGARRAAAGRLPTSGMLGPMETDS